MLITLAIIGIIAALTVPTLMKNYQRGVYEASFKRGYNMLSQAVAQAKIDGFDFKEFYYNGRKFQIFEHNELRDFAKTYLGATICPKTAMKVKGFNGNLVNNGNDVVWGNYDSSCLNLKNGMTLNMVSYAWLSANRAYLILDTNGINKKPNRWGYDWWAFEIDFRNNAKTLLVAGGTGNVSQHHEGYKCGSQGWAKAQMEYGCSYWATINKCPNDKTKTYWECVNP